LIKNSIEVISSYKRINRTIFNYQERKERSKEDECKVRYSEGRLKEHDNE